MISGPGSAWAAPYPREKGVFRHPARCTPTSALEKRKHDVAAAEHERAPPGRTESNTASAGNPATAAARERQDDDGGPEHPEEQRAGAAAPAVDVAGRNRGPPGPFGRGLRPEKPPPGQRPRRDHRELHRRDRKEEEDDGGGESDRGPPPVRPQAPPHRPGGLGDDRDRDQLERVQPCRLAVPAECEAEAKRTMMIAEGAVKPSQAMAAPAYPARR